MTSPPQTPIVFSPPLDKAHSPPEYRDRHNRLTIPGGHSESSNIPVQTRRSYDVGQNRADLSPAPIDFGGLSVPTSRNAKRRSINPGLVLSSSNLNDRPRTGVSAAPSPSSHSQFVSYPTPSMHSHDSPSILPEQSSSRRSSHVGGSPVASGAFYSALASPVPSEEKHVSDQPAGRSRSASASTYLPEHKPDKVTAIIVRPDDGRC